ncbi:MAG: hypothetical protein QG556_722 [Pseudomonadota bacterium]|nr:hypothetical protein [Pseudomonadota bacterium]
MLPFIGLLIRGLVTLINIGEYCVNQQANKFY